MKYSIKIKSKFSISSQMLKIELLLITNSSIIDISSKHKIDYHRQRIFR